MTHQIMLFCCFKLYQLEPIDTFLYVKYVILNKVYAAILSACPPSWINIFH